MQEPALQFDVSIISIVCAIVAIIGAVTLCWQSWQRSGKRVIWLELLRLLLILIAVLTLFQPEFVRVLKPKQEGVVKVLYDASGSMATEDVTVGDERQSRQTSLTELIAPESWSSITNTRIEIQPFANGAQSRSTDLNRALVEVTENPDDVRAVVLASDGDWNAGDSPATASRKLRQLGIPVFTVGVGSEQALPDVSISRFDLPTFAVVAKPLRIPFSISSTLPAPVDVPVTISIAGEEDQRVSVQVPARGQVDSVLSWLPTKIGDQKITIRIPTRDNDAIAENNEQTLPISIRYESLKVLMIDTFPRWEYRYTRNALMRDPGVTVNTLLLQPDFEGVGGGPGYLSEFPTSKSLFKYDVVFLGDVGIAEGQLTSQHCQQLKQLVQNHAGGLVLLPGFRGFQTSLTDSLLDELSPVEMDPDSPNGARARNSGYFRLTEAGRNSLLTRFETDAETNARIWKALPGFFWNAAALRAKPGATTLAVHDSASNRFGRVPMIATRSFGTGKVLFVGSDGAWRWRKGVEDKYHYRFWSQMVRWMAYQRTMAAGNSLRLVFSPDRPRSGDTLTLRVNAMADNGEPLQQGSIITQILTPSGKTIVVNLTRDSEEAWGLFRGSFVAEEGGIFKLATRCEETGATLESELNVAGAPLELVGRPARLDVMREISAITGGGISNVTDLSDVFSAVQSLPQPNPVVKRFQLWNHPLWGALLIGLLGIFWTGRKLTGLL